MLTKILLLTLLVAFISAFSMPVRTGSYRQSVTTTVRRVSVYKNRLIRKCRNLANRIRAGRVRFSFRISYVMRVCKNLAKKEQAKPFTQRENLGFNERDFAIRPNRR